MKRIALLIGTLNPYGAQRVVLDIATHLDRTQFKPYLIYWRDGELLKEFEKIPKLKIIKLKTKPEHTGKAFFNQYREIKKIIKENKIDILHTHMYVEDLYGSMIKLTNRKLKLISTKHDINQIPLWIRIPRSIFPKPDSSIPISHNVKNSMNEYSRVIHNGVDFDRIRSKKPEKYQKLTIVSVGRLIEKKGHRVLIRAVKLLNKQIKDFQLLIIGGGEGKFPAPKNVKFLGVQDDVIGILQKSHIFALMTQKEGLGISLIEASACKLPIVTSKIMGTCEVVWDGKNGYLVDPMDSYRVSKALLRLIKDSDLRKEMGICGYNIVKDKFSVKNMVKEYEKEYNSL